MSKTNRSDTLLICGFPLDDMDAAMAVSRIFSMKSEFDTDARTRNVFLINADLLRQLLSVMKRGEHSLANAVRQSDLLLPVGRSVSWAAGLSGSPIANRISGREFFSLFFSEAARKKASVTLVAGGGVGIRDIASRISDKYPGLKLAGFREITFFEKAESGAKTYERVVSYINSTGADFLLVDLSRHDARLWFERFKDRIYLPVIIGFCSLDYIKARADNKAVSVSTSSIYDFGSFVSSIARFTGRFLLRLAYSISLLFTLLLPFVLHQKVMYLKTRLFSGRPLFPPVKSKESKTAAGASVKIISLPDPLDAAVVDEIKPQIKQIIKKTPKVIVDLSNVEFIDSSGIGLILSLLREASQQNREVFLSGVSPSVYRTFRLSRTLDFFGKQMFATIEDVIESIGKRGKDAAFYYLALVSEKAVVYHFFGELDAAHLMDLDPGEVILPIDEKHVILNLSGLHFVDSSGLRLFVKIQRHASRMGKYCVLCGVRDHVLQIIRTTRLDRLFYMEPDIISAQKRLDMIAKTKSLDAGPA